MKITLGNRFYNNRNISRTEVLRIYTIFIVIGFICYIIVDCNEIIAESPSISRKKIVDTVEFTGKGNVADWYDIMKGEPIEGTPLFEWFKKKFPEVKGIDSVSFSSNGDILNASFWSLNKNPLNDNPLTYTPNYGLLIDIDPSGEDDEDIALWENVDYMLNLSFNNTTKTWNNILYEWSNNGLIKIISQENNTKFSNFSNKRNIDLSLDLNLLGYPSNYNVLFYEIFSFVKEKENYDIVDFTNWHSVPEPKFNVFVSPDNVSMKPGDSVLVDTGINITRGITNFQYVGEFYSDFDNTTILLQYFNETSNTFTSNGNNLDYSFGKIPSKTIIQVKIPEGVAARTVKIPFNFVIKYNYSLFGADTFLPFILNKNNLIQNDFSKSLELLYREPLDFKFYTGDQVLNDDILVTIKEPNITEFVNTIRINILAFWNENKEFITIISTISGVLIWSFKKIKKNKR
jgi:hypothetical protein